MRRIKPQNRRGGFGLIELLFVLLVLGMIGVIAGKFVGPLVRTMHGTADEATAEARFDNSMNVLRNEIWQSAAIRSEAGNRLVLTRADKAETTWEFNADKHLIQTGPESIKHDWGASTATQFAVDGAVVHVTVADGLHFNGGKFSMVCPVLLEWKP